MNDYLIKLNINISLGGGKHPKDAIRITVRINFFEKRFKTRHLQFAKTDKRKKKTTKPTSSVLNFPCTKDTQLVVFTCEYSSVIYM